MLNEGDIVPDFEFINRDGLSTNFHSVKGKKVVYFFPRAFTPGCTAQSCSIQASYPLLKEYGVSEVFGISLDSPQKQKKFAERYGLDYIFVSDQDRKISKAWGTYKNRILFKYTTRDTFLVDAENKIEAILHNGLRGKSSKLGLKKQGQEIINLIEDLPAN